MSPRVIAEPVGEVAWVRLVWREGQALSAGVEVRLERTSGPGLAGAADEILRTIEAE